MEETYVMLGTGQVYIIGKSLAYQIYPNILKGEVHPKIEILSLFI